MSAEQVPSMNLKQETGSPQDKSDKIVSALETLTKELQLFHKDINELVKDLKKNNESKEEHLVKIGKDLRLIKQKISPSDDYLNLYELIAGLYDFATENHKNSTKKTSDKSTTKNKSLEENSDYGDDVIKDIKNKKHNH